MMRAEIIQCDLEFKMESVTVENTPPRRRDVAATGLTT